MCRTLHKDTKKDVQKGEFMFGNITLIHTIPYAEASRDYVCNTSATTGRHVENFHITETTI